MGDNHIPYFNFFPSDFMNGVRGMTPQEIGVYTMILCRIYEENGPVECHELRLATYCGMRVPTFKKTLEKLIDLGKLYMADGMISNCRAEVEISKRAESLKYNSRAGKASAEKRQQKQRPEATPVERPFNHTDTDSKEVKREAKASPKNSRGNRLPNDWVLPGDWDEWALSQGLSQTQVKDQADRFRDYWVAKAGSGGLKLDWQATWRNWVRNNEPKIGAINGGRNEKSSTKSQQRMQAFLGGARL